MKQHRTGGTISGRLQALLAAFFLGTPALFAHMKAPTPYMTQTYGRCRTKGPVRPAGSKLARKAKAGRIGLNH